MGVHGAVARGVAPARAPPPHARSPSTPSGGCQPEAAGSRWSVGSSGLREALLVLCGEHVTRVRERRLALGPTATLGPWEGGGTQAAWSCGHFLGLSSRAQPCVCGQQEHAAVNQDQQALPPPLSSPDASPGPSLPANEGLLQASPVTAAQCGFSPVWAPAHPAPRLPTLEWRSMGRDLSSGGTGGKCGSDLSSVGSAAASATSRLGVTAAPSRGAGPGRQGRARKGN